jgi:hypothetical protein
LGFGIITIYIDPRLLNRREEYIEERGEEERSPKSSAFKRISLS